MQGEAVSPVSLQSQLFPREREVFMVSVNHLQRNKALTALLPVV